VTDGRARDQSDQSEAGKAVIRRPPLRSGRLARADFDEQERLGQGSKTRRGKGRRPFSLGSGSTEECDRATTDAAVESLHQLLEPWDTGTRVI
jgi:hypothetical protein